MFKIIAIIIVASISLSSQTFNDLKQNKFDFNTIREVFQNEFIGEANIDTLKGWKQFKRWEWFWSQRLLGQKELPNAMNIKKLAEYYKVLQKSKNSSVQSVLWEKYGPFYTPQGGGRAQGVGRINDVAMSPTQEGVLIVGAASGGAWRSTNAGQSWSEIDMTSQLSMGVSDIEFAPSNPNIVYMATGDADGSLGSNASYYSVGLLKSTDAGKTFTETSLYYSLGQSKLITRVLIHPTNPNIVLVASKDGIFKSTDGGDTWNNMFSNVTIKDMEFKPTDPNIVYASSMSFGGSNAIYKSTDNGDTWVQSHFISSALRTEIAVTPNAPNNVYIISCGMNRQFLSFQVSLDEANSWMTMSTQSTDGNILGWNNGGDLNKGQGSYDLAIAVNPKDQTDVYIGGVNIWHSKDGGRSWELHTHWYGGYNATEIHADQHRFLFNKSGSLLYVANDGGLYRNFTGTDNWDELNNGMDITQFYRLGVSQSSPFDVISGSQDNGTSRYDSQNWEKAYAGDGMECAIDPVDDRNVYISLPYGNIRRSTNGGQSFRSMISPDKIAQQFATQEYASWVTPYVLEPNNPKNIYVGYTNVWKSTNYGETNSWTKISDFNVGPSLTLNSIAVAPSNPDYIYTATNTQLKKTTNGGQTWELLHSSSSAITYIAVNPLNPDQIYITKSGFNTYDKVLFYDGTNWKDISGNLPPVPVNTIVVENPDIQSIYIGTDIGVFYSDLNSGYWVKLEGEMPNTVVDELEIHKSSGKLYAATYGRGLWRTSLLGCDAKVLPIKIIGDLEFCEGDSVILESVEDLPNYLWNTGEKTKRIVIKKSGNYVLTLPSSTYCSDKSDIISINVFEKDEKIIKASNGNTFCYNTESLRLVVPFSYKDIVWSTGQSSKFISVTEPGTYNVTAVNSNGCTVTDTITLYKSNLLDDIVINQTGNTLSVPNGYTYKWFHNDTIIQGENSNILNIKELGKYSVEITDEFGCTLKTQVYEVTTEVKSLAENKSIRVYPTVTVGTLNIQTFDIGYKGAKLELYSLMGKKLEELQLNSNSSSNLDISEYVKGTYFIKIIQNNEAFYQKIILK